MSTLLSIHSPLRRAARFPATRGETSAATTSELALLVGLGVVAAALSLVRWQLRVPGHAILCAALPMTIGLSVVPRHFAGTLMTASAGVATALALALGMGRPQPAAVTAVLAIGPALDLAMHSARDGRWLYLRFLAAGAGANLLASGVRMASLIGGLDAPGSRAGSMSWGWMLASFVACGVVAGLLGAAAGFRVRAEGEGVAHPR